MTSAEVQAELPSWRVLKMHADSWVAYSPNNDFDGICVQAPTAEELIERVRALVQVLAIAAERAGRLQPDVDIGGVWSGNRLAAALNKPINGTAPFSRSSIETTSPPRSLGLGFNDPSSAKQLGYTGNQCPNCMQFSLVRNGSCEKCMSCGGTTGCS